MNTFGLYHPGTSILHRLPAGPKLVVTAAVIVVLSLWVRQPWQVIPAAVLAVIAYSTARIPLRLTVVLYPTFQLFLVPLFLIGFAGLLFASAPATRTRSSPAVVATLYLERVTGPALFAGLLAGAAATITLAVMPAWRPFGIHGGLWGLALNVAAVALVSWLGPAADGARAARHLAIARGDEIVRE